jgi:hypothetical protein
VGDFHAYAAKHRVAVQSLKNRLAETITVESIDVGPWFEFAPRSEQEVVALFGLLLPRLKRRFLISARAILPLISIMSGTVM